VRDTFLVTLASKQARQYEHAGSAAIPPRLYSLANRALFRDKRIVGTQRVVRPRRHFAGVRIDKLVAGVTGAAEGRRTGTLSGTGARGDAT
jgi:hypothetical protein